MQNKSREAKKVKVYFTEEIVEEKRVEDSKPVKLRKVNPYFDKIADFLSINEINSAIELIKTLDSNEYHQLIKDLFMFYKNTKNLIKLTVFIKKTITEYEIDYQNIKHVIKECYYNDMDSKLIEIVIRTTFLQAIKDTPEFSIEIFKEIFEIIDEYNTQNSSDLITGLRNITGNLYVEFVKYLCFGNINKEYKKSIKNFYKGNLKHLVYIGTSLYKSNFNFELSELIYSNVNDRILNNILNEFTCELYKKHTNQLLKIVIKRVNLDDLNALVLKNIDISQVSENNLRKIFRMFYFNPLNFVKYKLFKHGFDMDEDIALELIKSMTDLYDEELFKEASKLVKPWTFKEKITELFIEEIIKDDTTYLFKRFALEYLLLDGVQLQMFVKFCLYIANEDDLTLLKFGLNILLNLRLKKNYASYFYLIDQWKMNKNLSSLIRRIYPLANHILDNKKKSKEEWFKLLEEEKDQEEKTCLIEIYANLLEIK
ncbi:hypothetical protein A0H76_800 [Hepatospora eriocheir]|uniref:Uncharacterized protein n=1 Tax=Hepatospora eriocheir TaxID=1081669 RepID=A0A1X0QI71_9MICR|nr:hypothetical protein A0H76_800 [Hepatospora eriocheir]